MNNASRQTETQIREWRARKEQQRVSNLATAEADIAAMHTAILDWLVGTDPDDLATVTRGRVTCPVEHRAHLRDLIARPMALEPGMVVPWRLVGHVAPAQQWARWSPSQPAAWCKDDWTHHALEYGVMLGFLLTASQHARTCGWRWHIVEPDEVAAISRASAAELLRIAVEYPRLGLVFAPPDAQEQDCARRIRDTELGFQRLAEAKLRTRSLLARVMRP